MVYQMDKISCLSITYLEAGIHVGSILSLVLMIITNKKNN